MNINWRMIVGDMMVIASFGFAAYRWNYVDRGGLKYFWVFFGLYLLIRQCYRHYEYYRDTKRIY